MKNVKNMVFTALCIAIGIILPMAFHAIPNAGSIFLPMHIAVLLCGLLCGPVYGLTCGVLVPFLSSILTGMPPAFILPSMVCELAVYGVLSGYLTKVIFIKNEMVSTYIQLILAMLAGRVVYGALNALVFSAGTYSFEAFITAAFVTSLPGIILQLLVLPSIVLVLKKAGTMFVKQVA